MPEGDVFQFPLRPSKRHAGMKRWPARPARHEISSCEGGLLKRCFLCQGVQRSDEEAREVVEKVGDGLLIAG